MAFESVGIWPLTPHDLGKLILEHRYPGARVDCEIPYYQLNIPEVYKTFSFTEKFPGHVELRRYIQHIDNVLDIRKDCTFNASVNDVTWQKESSTWRVSTAQGHQAECKYLFLCSGILCQKYAPDLDKMSLYKGTICHSSAYPQDLFLKGKKVIVVGAGATGVQITQEVGKQASSLSLLVRRPTFCLPLRQRTISEQESDDMKALLPAIMMHSRKTLSGLHVIPQSCGTFDVDDQQRRAVYEAGWKTGGFATTISCFPDLLFDAKANREYYDFWKEKTRLRLTDPIKQRIMCPDEPTYMINTKRPPLEQDYYDVLNQPNVNVVDISSNAISCLYENGIVMADGTKVEADVIILATGFDSYTGSLSKMGIKSKDGELLTKAWEKSISTHLALTVPGFPNMFLSYTPQSPAALSNATTLIEAQVDTVVDMISKLEEENAKSIEAQQSAADKWAAGIDAIAAKTLIPQTDSWWNRSNVPGAQKQNLIYLPGIETYEKECRASIEKWTGFDVVYA